MEKYFISYYVNVYEDSYTHGEGEEINSYSGNGLNLRAKKMRINQEIYFYYLNKKSNKKSIFQKFIFRKNVINIHQIINYNTYLEYYHFNETDYNILLLQANKHKIYKYLFDYIKKIELGNLQKNRRYYTYKKYFKKLQDKYLNSLK